tara:strand:+ start:106 stop:390 length:285 start_codon:yes stop_codon:yes gene_type:complete
VVLHPFEDHDAVAPSASYLRAQDIEKVRHTKILNLGLDQALRTIPESALNLSYAHNPEIRVSDHRLNSELSEEVRAPSRTPTSGSLVPNRLKQG